MIKSVFAGVALAISVSTSMAAGDSVIVDFEARLGGVPWYTGVFAGTDTNDNGVISFSELTSFVATQQGTTPSLVLSDLRGFGDFTIATDSWINNGAGWTGYSSNAFITWDNGSNSLNASDNASVTTSITSLTSAVPEPTTLAMMGLGAVALVGVRRKRKSI